MKYFALFICGLLIHLTSFSGMSVKKINSLPSRLKETSGLELYKGKYLLSHNDSGGKSEIYLLNLEGEIVKTVFIDEAKNVDWEDITLDDKGKLFIGDFGNNLNKRKKCQIYIVGKDLDTDPNDQINAKKITFSYEDQKDYPPKKKNLNFDAEAFFWMKDSLYILTKCRAKPFTGLSKVYVLPTKPGKYKARKIGEFNLCSSNWYMCSVTAADYNEKTNTLAVLTYTRLYLFQNFPGNRIWEGKVKSYHFGSMKQREAICFKSSNELYLSDEYRKGFGGGNLYKIEIK